MTIRLLLIVACSLSASAVIPSLACAAEGRITFSGAVVEATCSVAAPVIAMVAAIPHGVTEVRQLTCATSGNASVAPPQRYALTVVRLSSSVPDRVLKYFDNYVRASYSNAADPVLLTQVYE